jgi:vacuolar-type H+-ATPase subunit F/Vma7
MVRAVAVGERHLILGFKGAGFEIAGCDSSAALHTELSKLSRDADVALVLVTESMAKESPDAIEAFRERSRAIMSIIPTHEGSQHYSFQLMKKAVERSIGVDILGKES